jgi:glycosyltransferase involved in cell wall biosynthesis
MRARALPMAKALVARGHTVTILLPPWQHPEDAGRRWEEDGVVIENVRLPPSIPGVFHGATALRLARRALALRPDVVHLFKPKAYSGLTHWLLARLPSSRRPRLIVDADDWEGPGGWNALADYTALQRRFFTWQERWGLTHADAVTVASRALESLVWALGVSPERVFYVPNGVRERGEGRDRERAAGACILLYTRFFEFPVSRVIDVLRRVRERVPQARLLVVGEGLFGEEEELFRLAADAGLRVARPSSSSGGAEHVGRLSIADSFSAGSSVSEGSEATEAAPADITYVGWVPSERLPSYFALADIAIYPFDDTLVNRTKCAAKLGDLLVAGVPVVAEAVGQNREYIRDGETGLLVEPGDVSSFAGSVVRLLSDPSLRHRLGRAAARDVRERFGWERLVDAVERAYGVGV